MSSFDITNYGAKGDGDIANAGVNTAAFLQAIAAGGAYVPPSAGFVVNNGQIRVGGNVKIWGEASMGSNPQWGNTSHIIGHGPGDTLAVSGGGCLIAGTGI